MFALLLTLAAAAGPPSLTTPANAGGAPGMSITLPLAGKNLESPSAMIFDANPLDVKFGKDSATFTVPKDTPLGVHGIRIVTAGGVSNVRPFIVDSLPEVKAVEGRIKRDTAQSLTMPCVVVGTSTTEASDFFRVSVKANQTLSFDLLGKRLGSPFDPVLILHDGKSGRELPGLYADDTVGLLGDARLTHTFARDTELLIEVRDATFRGGPEHAYRLRIHSDPPEVLRQLAMPAAAKVTLSAQPEIGWGTPWGRYARSSEHAEELEREPNNDAKTAMPLSIPSGITASFAAANDRDFYRVRLAKDQKIRIRAEARAFGFSTEVLLTVLDPAGKELARSNTEKLPAEIDFTAPAAADYIVVAEELNFGHGPWEAYHLSITPRVPDARVSLAADHVVVPGTLPLASVERFEGTDSAIDLKWIGEGEFIIKPIPAKAAMKADKPEKGDKNEKPEPPLKIAIEAKPGTKPGVYSGRIVSTVKGAPSHAVATADVFRKEWNGISVSPAALEGMIVFVVK